MRLTLVCLSVILAVAAVPVDCLGWGAITHAYLAHRLGERCGPENLQEIYGATVSDMFNVVFDSPYSDYMSDCMHYRFDEIRPYARTPLLEAAMLGIASHNDAWGADYTAHHRSRSLWVPEGYVFYKEGPMASFLEPQLADLLADAGVPDAEAAAAALARGLTHNLVETAVDLLISRNEDPPIGWRLLASAQLRAPGIPLMVAGAFAGDLAARYGISRLRAWAFIIRVEREYRELMKMYGGIFTKDFEEAVELLSQQGAYYAEIIIESFTGVAVAVAPELVGGLLVDFAIPLVEGDYFKEIAHTCVYLEERLREEGYTSSPLVPLAKSEERPFLAAQPATKLAQNHPNPFNPSTTISFALEEPGRARLCVYDAAGRMVATPVEGTRPAGEHSVVWDGRGNDGTPVSSGGYFYRLRAEALEQTRKMLLLR